MKQNLASYIMGAAFLVVFAGCGGAPTHESLLKESITQMDALATTLETAKSVDEVKPKVDAIVAKFLDLKKQAEALKTPEAKQKELEASLKPDMEKAVGRMMKAMMAISVKDPTGIEKLSESFSKVAGNK